MKALLWAISVGFEAACDAWRDARGSQAIDYRFEVGDRVVIKDTGIDATVVRRWMSDEKYDLSNGWSFPGYALMREKRKEARYE